jgi:membrane protein YqaA with SNARE-associated domain
VDETEPKNVEGGPSSPEEGGGDLPHRKTGIGPTRNPLKRMYAWVLSWAKTPYAAYALFALAFAEATFFPIPPDVLLIALGLGATKKSLRYAAVCTLGSILGAVAGYAIGWAAAPFAKTLIAELAGLRFYYQVAGAYGENAFLAIAVAGFTPIPYKVFTLAAGIFHETVSLWVLVGASLCSRTARFFLVALLIYAFGPPVRRFIEKYFNVLALALGAGVVLGFLLLGGLGGSELPLESKVDVLLTELAHGDAELRAEAASEMKRLASERGWNGDFGYDPARPPGENAEAIGKWRQWWARALTSD